MNDILEQVASLPQLTESQRIEARQHARKNMIARAGGEPQFEDFERRHYSKYSPEIERFVKRAIWSLFVAAFVLSATHIYTIARSKYAADGIPFLVTVIGGACFVLTADIAAIVFMSAPGVYGHVMDRTAKSLSYFGAFLAALVAVIFNVAVAIDFDATPLHWLWRWLVSFTTDPVSFMVATLPPLFVLILGYVQKSRILSENERRHGALVEYNAAVAEYRAWLSNIEHDPQWAQAWANALWDAWSYRKRRDVLARITPEVKRALVLREMQAEKWWNSEGIPSERPERSAKHVETLLEQMDSTFDDWSQAEKAHWWLKERPELLTMGVKDATALLGIGNSTYYKAKDLYSSNGHHKPESGNSEGV